MLSHAKNQGLSRMSGNPESESSIATESH